MQRIRQAELSQVVAALRAQGIDRGKLLEIGAGAGWQSKALADAGYEVQAIDVGKSEFAETRIWPVQNYDGKTIPFPDESFDVVFSSNVLEHIPWVESFQLEMMRVLKPNGIAIHLLPTCTWRFWTSVMHYPFVAQYVAKTLYRKSLHAFGKTPPPDFVMEARENKRASPAEVLRAITASRRHGEFGNLLTEHWYFSRFRWSPLFARTGWVQIRRTGNKLYYSGQGILAGVLSVHARRHFSSLLGSSCHVYSMRKREADEELQGNYTR